MGMVTRGRLAPLAFLAMAMAMAVRASAAEPIHEFAGVVLSPNAEWIASIEAENPASAHLRVVVRDRRGRVMEVSDPCAVCRYAHPAWSSDSAALAYVAENSSAGTSTLYSLRDHLSAPLVFLRGVARSPAWSPDSRSVAFLFIPGARRTHDARDPGEREVGLVGAPETLALQRLAIVAAQGGEPQLISPPDRFVYEFDWLRDGAGLVATTALGEGTTNWWAAELDRIGRDGSLRRIVAPTLQISHPRALYDNEGIIFVGGITSDFDPNGGDLFYVALRGGEPRNLTQGFAGTFTTVSPTQTGAIGTIIKDGKTGLAALNLSRNTVEILSLSEESLTAETGRFSASFDVSGNYVAAVRETFSSPPEIQFGRPAERHAITHENEAVSTPFVAHSVAWESPPYRPQGWVLMPTGTEPEKPRPMITLVHGGPSSAWTPKFPRPGVPTALLQAGYIVFEPNPRGSYGQGEDFTIANRRDFGGGDFADILAGAEEVARRFPVDIDRLGITGFSYGGFMTMWAATHSTRFRAAVAGAGIADWLSYYGENRIEQWLRPFFGASPYDDPAIYDRLSPVRNIKAASTPMLLYVGERDVECPPTQSRQFWRALLTERVPTRLVVYPDEGHGILTPEHVDDLSRQVVEWFDEYIK
jgi:dipeptidyl aminopeptidase/acylaminoacyl peptidase